MRIDLVLILCCVLCAAAAPAQDAPWWDSFPLIVQSSDIADSTYYHATIAFGGGNTDPTWGVYGQKVTAWPWATAQIHNAGLKAISYFETFGTTTTFIAELGERGTAEYTPLSASHWSWQIYHGGPIAWIGVANYWDDEDYARPFTYTHPRYGSRRMTYPDGALALGYNGASTDPRNSRVLDAGSAKNILGGFLYDYGYNESVNAPNPQTGQPAGPLDGLLATGSGYSGHVSVGKDSACPYWIDYAYASTLLAADEGLDGIWTDNHSPWDSFGHPPVNVAFGEWSVAKFRAYLADHFTPAEVQDMGVGDIAAFDIRADLRAKALAWGGIDTDLTHHVWRDARWLNDPLWRAYMIYKRQTGTAALDSFYNAVKTAAAAAGKPDFFVAGNDIPFFSLGWPRGSLDAVSTEMSPGWHMGSGSRGIMLPPAGRFAPVYKLAREHARSRFVNIWMYLDEPYQARPGIAGILSYEMLANHALPMIHPDNPKVAGTPESNEAFFQFVAAVTPLFGPRVPVEEVGIYYSSSSVVAFMTPGGFQDMDRQPHQFGFYGWATALGNLHYQYRAVPEWKLDRQTLDALRVLIIPNAEVIPPDVVHNVIEPWVNDGGALIVTGASGARLGEDRNFDFNPDGSCLAQLIAAGPALNVQHVPANMGMDYYLANVQRTQMLPQFAALMSTAFAGSQPMIREVGQALPATVGINVYRDETANRLFVDVNNLNIDLAVDSPIPTPPLTFDVRLPVALAGKGVLAKVVSPGGDVQLSLIPAATDTATVSLSPTLFFASVMLDADSDSDGLSDIDEQNGTFGYITNPYESDTDGDGLSDFQEINASLGYATDPTDSDSDEDGLNDHEEILIWHTSPLNTDTDGDGASDGAEVRLGTDPTDPLSRLTVVTPAALAAAALLLLAVGCRKLRIAHA